jgi:hypothetical protein
MNALRDAQGAVDEARRVPRAAKYLGAAGIIPFVAIAITGPFLTDPLKNSAFLALIAYGAVILSFLGGIHWGLSIATSRDRGTGGASFRRLGVSVLPALIGWVALIVDPLIGIFILAISFGLVLAVDLDASRKGQAPAWYPSLRCPLTLGVIASLLIGALA